MPIFLHVMGVAMVRTWRFYDPPVQGRIFFIMDGIVQTPVDFYADSHSVGHFLQQRWQKSATATEFRKLKQKVEFNLGLDS